VSTFHPTLQPLVSLTTPATALPNERPLLITLITSPPLYGVYWHYIACNKKVSCQTLDRLPAIEVFYVIPELPLSYPRFSPQVATCIAVVRAPLLLALDCLQSKTHVIGSMSRSARQSAAAGILANKPDDEVERYLILKQGLLLKYGLLLPCLYRIKQYRIACTPTPKERSLD